MRAESADISVTLASDLQLCLYAHTHPQCFELYRPFSIPWHLSLHLLDRVLSQNRNHDIMVLSDLAKFGLESGVWIDEYKYQNKDNKHYKKYESVIFSMQCIIAKTFDSSLCYCCHLGSHLEYFRTRKTTTTICQSNSPNTTTVENYRKLDINFGQVEFCFKMAAILDTILNI